MRRTLQDILQAFPAAIQAERMRWFYWSPVAVAVGIGLYFSLYAEPWGGVGLLFLLPLLGLSIFYRQRVVFIPLLLCLLIALGFSAAQLRTALVAAPMLTEKIGPLELEGRVVARELQEDGARLMLAELAAERMSANEMPKYIRLTLRAGMALPPLGARVKVLANLLPPMEPAFPGAYNFRREAFFKQIGAYGLALRAPEILQASGQVSVAERAREEVVSYVTTLIPGAEGAIAAALMTGERGAIDDKTNADMRAAGTTHLLSISGMHIGMVGGFVFFLLRALLALVPYCALNWPLKKIAAVAGLAAVIVYTWFVGAPIPAQRAAFMAGLVFLAVLLDRQAVTQRTVVLAALVILLLFPEALLNPGFQMSFAAIVLLIAAYEAWDVRRAKAAPPGYIKRAGLYVGGIIITSLIAGLATMPFGAWHFHRLQLLGVLGNLIAVPLTGFIVMPAMVLAYILLPFGLAHWPLQAMGWGLQGVTQSAAWIATLPLANINIGQLGLSGLIIFSLGGLWLALWQGRIRWLSVPVMALGILLLPSGQQPVALIHSEGRIAVRGSDGLLYVARTPAKGIVLEQWALAFADGQPIENWRAPKANVKCDALGCVYGGWLAFPELPVAQREDCPRAKVVAAPDLRLKNCPAPVVIDRDWLRARGSTLVYADGSVKTLRQPDARRAWEPMLRASYTSGSSQPDGLAP